MKTLRTCSLLSIAAVVAALTGCGIRAPVVPPVDGALVNLSAVTFPVDTDFQPGALSTRREGRAESMSILGLVALGETGIARAAENGGIAVVQHVDASYFNVLFVYQRYETIVWGLSAEEAAAAGITKDKAVASAK